MSANIISKGRLCSLAMGYVLWALTYPAHAVPAVYDNNVYPVSSTASPSTEDWPLDLRRNMSQTTDLKEFIMRFVQDERICTSKSLYDMIVGQDNSDIRAVIWWSKRCGGQRSGGGKTYSPLPESTLIRYRRKSSNRRSTQHSNSEISKAEQKKLDKLLKNKKIQCNPKKAVVELPNDDSSRVVLKPSCVYIKQCGGCCDSPLLECLPTQTKIRKFKVLAIKRKSDNNPSSGQLFKRVEVVEHKKCSCQCKERPEHCTVHQVYDEAACQCTCPRNANRSCTDRQFWDPDQCKCVCKDVHNCTTGRFFDHNTCRCEDPEYKDVFVS